VLFLLKTNNKPPKNNQYQNTKSKQFVPSLMYHGTWYDKTKTKPKPMYLFYYQKVAIGRKTKVKPNQNFL
jgi:hypothetical protein